MSDDLVEFLLARIAEDQQAANYTMIMTSARVWNPARFRAECEARRRIVEDFQEYAADYRAAPSDFAAGRRHAALLAVTRIAAVYADHPDYRQEWRP